MTELERRGEGSSEAAREHAGRVVHGVYRLVKGCLLHADSNQAITQLVDGLVQAVSDYLDCTKGSSVAILFASNNVFVDRQMLRTSRETYQLAVELGQMIEPFGVTEIAFSRPLDRAEVQDLGRVVALAQRERASARAERLAGYQTIRARRVVAFAGQQLTPVQRAARTFAASVLILQGFYKELRQGARDLPHGVKRVAQRLVTAAEEDSRLLLVIAASPGSDADRPALAVSTAIIALAMARQLASDRSALLALASAALLYDVGRARLARSAMSQVERNLTDAELEKLPASTVAALTALGKLHPGSLSRGVLAYEALALRGGMGKVYGGRRPPSVLARVLHAARLFVEARATRGPLGAQEASMDDAVQALQGQARDATERTFAKLLLGALGLFPAGTLVELTTGELAVVTATPRLPVDFARPPVRILYDKDANLLEDPIDLDLAHPPAPGQPPRLIRKTVDADEQQMRQMRAYVVGLSTAATRTPRKEPPRQEPARPPTAPAPVPTVAPRRPVTDPAMAKATLPPRPRTGRSAAHLAALSRQDLAPVVSELPPVLDPSVPSVPPSAPRSSAPPLSRAPVTEKEPAAAREQPPPSAAVSSRSRRDPRAEDDEGALAAFDRSLPSSRPLPRETIPDAPPRRAPSVAPSQPPPDPIVAPAAIRARPNATHASTRAMSWDQLGQLRNQEAAAEPSKSSLPPPANETDALLAAYVEDSPSRGGGRSHGGIRAFPHEPASARNSAGLRWGGERDSRGSSGGRDSSSHEPRSSSGGEPRRVPGDPASRPSASSWGGAPSSRGGQSSSGSVSWGSRSGRGRTKTTDWTLGRGTSGGAPSSRVPTPPPPPPDEGSAGPTSRKPKAGSTDWGRKK